MPVMNKLSQDRTNPEYLNAKEMLDSQLKVVQKAYDYIDVMLINPAGKIIYHTNETHIERYLDKSFSTLHRNAFNEGTKRIYISDIYKNNYEDYKYGIYITGPVHDLNANFLGVVAFEVDMKDIFGFIQDTTGLGETGETLLGKNFSDKALFLNPLRHDKSAALNRWVTYEQKSAFPIKEAVNGRNGYGLSFDYRGKEIIAAWRYVPVTDWGLVAKIDTEEAFAPVAKLRQLIFIISGGIFVVAILVLYFFARSIIEPIISLAGMAKMVSTGDLNQQAEVRSNDELGLLVNSFNEMVINLKINRENLVRVNIENSRKNKELEELLVKLKKSQNILVHAEKMNAIGILTAGIAHELNNPMMGLINFVQYCLKHTVKDDRRYSVLADAEQEVKRCMGIVNNLRTIMFYEVIND